MKTILSNLIMPLFMLFQQGCLQQYYQTNTTHAVVARHLSMMSTSGKNFIVHEPDGVFGLTGVSVNGDTLYGERVLLGGNLTKNLYPEFGKGNPVHDDRLSDIDKEVHIYTEGYTNKNGRLAMALTQIRRMDVYSIDMAAMRRQLAEVIAMATIVLTASAAFMIAMAEVVLAYHRRRFDQDI
jgi:hypothetical protein